MFFIFVFIDFNSLLCYNILTSFHIWLVGQAVKTPASHAGNTGSIPVRVTIFSLCAFFAYFLLGWAALCTFSFVYAEF